MADERRRTDEMASFWRGRVVKNRQMCVEKGLREPKPCHGPLSEVERNANSREAGIRVGCALKQKAYIP